MEIFRKNVFYAILSFSILLASCSEQEKPSIPSIEVATYVVEEHDVPVILEFVGETKGLFDIEITARVDGWIEKLYFKEGGTVSKGQLLYTIDPAPYIAKVNAAKGNLAEANTMVVKAKNDYDRVKPLAEMKAMSIKDLDAAAAALGAAEGKRDAANASLKSAQIELGYTKITSPVTGVIGVSAAREGDYIGKFPNPLVLNTVSDVSSIRVRFSITEKEYLDLMRLIDTTKNQNQSREKYSPILYLADGTIYDQQGSMNIFDRQIDPKTGTLLMEALFPNPNGLLIPGLFVRLKGKISTLKNAIAIPQRAVRELQGTYQVAVIGKGNKIEYRNVTVGIKYKDLWVIENGLNPGDKIIIIGNQAIQSGMKVKPKFINMDLDSVFSDYLNINKTVN